MFVCTAAAQAMNARRRWALFCGCLGRAKRLVDLMVKPMNFDRIDNLGNSSTMKARL